MRKKRVIIVKINILEVDISKGTSKCLVNNDIVNKQKIVVFNKERYPFNYKINTRLNDLFITQAKAVIDVSQQLTCLYCKKKFPQNQMSTHMNSHPSKILDWLYIGTHQNALDKKELKSLKIKHILNCASECQSVQDKDYNYKHLKLIDKPNYQIIDHFNSAIVFLEEAQASNSKVLVHCKMGLSRSVSIVISFLMKSYHYTPQQAYRYIKARRENIYPNIGFMEQLRLFDSQLQKQIQFENIC